MLGYNIYICKCLYIEYIFRENEREREKRRDRERKRELYLQLSENSIYLFIDDY